MDLERYRVPASVRDGVVIELPGSKDAKFRVALPSEHNRAFMAAQQAILSKGGLLQLNDAGKPEIGQMDVEAMRQMQDASVEAFLEICILEYPNGMTPELLGGEYWPALKALFVRACDMAADEAAAAKATVKKSRA